MPRHLLQLAYAGTHYHGWQRQPHSSSVQQTLEETLSLLLGTPTAITGCGRTDTGVHASAYVAHVDVDQPLPPNLLRRLNRMLPADIAVYAISPAPPSKARLGEGLHARFDATHRAYRYDLTCRKDPFRVGQVWHYHAFQQLDVKDLNATAKLLLDYSEFAPFCKTNSDAKTMRCDLRRSEWVLARAGTELHYHIGANRFLRGMVRLIVGACVQVALGKLTLDQVRTALDQQTPLPKPLSAPADGLYLTEVHYGDLFSLVM